MESVRPQQAGGNRERHMPSKEDEGLRKVQSAGDQAAHSDCQ
jgi:hypothetical protein